MHSKKENLSILQSNIDPAKNYIMTYFPVGYLGQRLHKQFFRMWCGAYDKVSVKIIAK